MYAVFSLNGMFSSQIVFRHNSFNIETKQHILPLHTDLENSNFEVCINHNCITFLKINQTLKNHIDNS